MITNELFLGLLAFSAVTCFTPGPNNAMLLASGVNFGWSRSLPHVFGVALGFAFMVLAVGLGVGQLFEIVPELYFVLRVASIVYLLWLAWSIATAGAPDEPASGARPLTFIEAALFQWINPKAWVMALGATTTFAAAEALDVGVAVMAVVFAVMGFGSSASWAGCGVGLRRYLQRPGLVRAFNFGMAALLVASLGPVIAEWRR